MKPAQVYGDSIGIVQTSDAPDFLGYAIWYVIGKARIPHELLVELLVKYGLEKYAPSPPSKKAAFIRACNALNEITLEEDRKNNERTTVLVRRVDKNTRAITIENIQRKDVNYTPAAYITYEDGEIYPMVIDERAREVVEKIVETWKEEIKCHTEEKLRDILLEILAESGKIRLRTEGAIYFVPADHFPKVEKFGMLLDELKTRGVNCELWYAPIVNTEKFKKMIELKVNENLQDRFKALFEKVEKVLAGEKAIKDLPELSAEVEKIVKVAEIYEEILNTEMKKVKKLYDIIREIGSSESVEEAQAKVEAMNLKERFNELLKAFTEGDE